MCHQDTAKALDVYIESFLPLFVAIDAVGILPLFISLTDGMSLAARRRLAVQASTTAFVVAILILFAGEFIFTGLGITLNDLRVGGGLILLVLSIVDLIFTDFRQRNPEREAGSGLGVVPIGIPLIMGPAAITTILVTQQGYGYLPALASLLANLGIAAVVFYFGPMLMDRLGASAAKAIAKIASLFLAAIAVAMIRAGIFGMIAG